MVRQASQVGPIEQQQALDKEEKNRRLREVKYQAWGPRAVGLGPISSPVK